MIQDWGFNYIYLRKQEAITRINLANHSYRDVARTPVENFESATTRAKSSVPSWIAPHKEIWMCGASEEGGSKGDLDISACDEAYIPEPFPEADLEPSGWRDILATLDVCVNEVTPTVFCDEEGYDLAPFQMIRVIPENETIPDNEQRNVNHEEVGTNKNNSEAEHPPIEGTTVETAVRQMG